MSSVHKGLNRRLLQIAFTGVATACLALPGSLQAQDASDVFNKKCAVCHGKDGLGNTVKGKKVHVKPVSTNIKNTEADQIKALVEYYRSLAGTAAAKK